MLNVPSFRIRRVYLIGVTVCALAIAILVYLRPELAPWIDTGKITIYVYEVPHLTEHTTTFGVGIESLLLTGNTSRTIRNSIRRIQFAPHEHTLVQIADMNIPAGMYDGISVMLKSPELRNDWHTDIAPQPISLTQEHIHIPLPIHIKTDEQHVLIVGFETENTIRNGTERRQYLPVFQIEHRMGADTTFDPTLSRVEGGVILHSGTYGMDWDGTMRYNFRAPEQAEHNEEHITPVAEVPHIEASDIPKVESIKETELPDEQATTSQPEEVLGSLDVDTLVE